MALTHLIAFFFFKDLTSRSQDNSLEGGAAWISNNKCQEFVKNTRFSVFARGGGAGVDCCVWGGNRVRGRNCTS